jgi:hypothetical protein
MVTICSCDLVCFAARGTNEVLHRGDRGRRLRIHLAHPYRVSVWGRGWWPEHRLNRLVAALDRVVSPEALLVWS